jgi:hypothetical protein
MSRNSDRDDRDEPVEEQRGEPVDRSQSRSASSESAASANGEYASEQDDNHPGTGRESPQTLHLPHERPTLPSRSRERVVLRGRNIHVSAAERVLMTEIGTFRTLAVSDLIQYRYGNDLAKLRQDLVNLKAQKLVRQRRVMAGKGREKFTVLTLTKQGKHFLQKESAGPSGQIFYADFVKPREVAHDTAIYRMCQAEAANIQWLGGGIRRIVLDYELKKAVYSPLARARELPAFQFAKRQAEIAAANGLRVVEGKIPLPDLRIEYETGEGTPAKVDLELLTEHYHGSHAAAKANAGFKMYAASADASRLNGSMSYGRSTIHEGRELTAAILSL